MPRSRPDAGESAARSRSLWIAAALALAATAWASFQWYELLVSRAGGQVVCGPGGGHCAEVWDSPFASAVHARTGLPVAAWGVVWGLAALALPLVARLRLGRGRAAEPWIAGTRVVALAGVAGVAVLLTASLLFGHFCATCGLTYALVLGYAGVAALGLGFASAELARGAGLAAGAAALAYALLFVPGQRTPPSAAASGARALESLPALASGTPDEREIVRFIASLPPNVKQLLSDTLAAYAASPVWTPPPARTVMGSATPRLALTEFTDTLCPHCAQMHETLAQLRERFGPDAFSLAPHQYPLDPSCNPAVHREDSEPLRCLAALVQICAEGKPGEFEFVGTLFRNQASLTEPMLWKLAEPIGTRAELEACAHSPETQKKLRDDIDWATAHEIQGTPLVLVGGRQAIAFPPLLYVLALSRGATSSPAYAALPPPQPLPWAQK